MSSIPKLAAPVIADAPIIRPHKLVVINHATLQDLLANPVCDPDVTHVIWLVPGSLFSQVLALFPNTLYLQVKGLRLKSLDPLVYNGKPVMPFLTYIDCSNNLIVSLYGIHLCLWLTELNCRFNRLITLDYLQGCIRLIECYCEGNPIRDFTAILYLSQLYDFTHDGDTDAQPACVRKIMVALQTGSGIPTGFRPNFYMFDETFIKSAYQAIHSLMKDPKPTVSFFDTDTSAIDSKVLADLKALCANHPDVHQSLRFTFSTLLDYVWQRIMTSKRPAILQALFSKHMAYAPYLNLSHLFRYTILSISKAFSDLAITYSRESMIDRYVSIIEDENDGTDVLVAARKVFTMMANQNYGYELAFSTVDAMVARANSRLEVTPFEAIRLNEGNLSELDLDYAIDSNDFSPEVYNSLAASRPAHISVL